MPRGRPKGSKNTPSLPKNMEGMEWGIKEIAENKIIWHIPMQPPYMTREKAESILAARQKNNSLISVEIVNMLDRERKFKGMSIDTTGKSAMIPTRLEGTSIDDNID